MRGYLENADLHNCHCVAALSSTDDCGLDVMRTLLNPKQFRFVFGFLLIALVTC